MVSASVRNAVVDFPVMSAPQIQQENTPEVSFDDFFQVALDDAQEEPARESDSLCKVSEQDKIDEASANTTTEATTTEEKTQVNSADEKQDKHESDMEECAAQVDDETVQTVQAGLEEIVQTIQDMLNVSQEELEEVLEQNGMDMSALLNPENLQMILSQVLGVESPIEFVTDEGMYVDLQMTMQSIQEQIDVLAEQTQLSPKQLEELLQQLQVAPEEVVDAVPEMLVSQDASVTEDVEYVVEETAIEQGLDTTETVIEVQESTTQEQNSEEMAQGQQEAVVVNPQTQLENAVENVEVPQETRAYPFDTESILKQLADVIKIKHGENLTEMELQLHPASLGNVHIQLTSKAGIVTAQISAQNEMVKEAIESQVVELRTNLEAQGVKIEAIEISVASHQMERNLDENGRQQQNQEEEQAQRVAGTKRRSINLRSIEEGIDMLAGNEVEDDAVRIAMEMMSMNGNSMDLLA